MQDLVHARVTFNCNSDNTDLDGVRGGCTGKKIATLTFCGIWLASSWSRDELKEINSKLKIEKGGIHAGGSRNSYSPIVEEGTTMFFDFLPRSKAEEMDEYECCDVEIIELEGKDKQTADEAGRIKAEAAEIRRQAKEAEERAKVLADARIAKERAEEELLEQMKRLAKEQDDNDRYEEELERAEDEGIGCFFDEEEKEQKRGCHYFFVFNETITKRFYFKLAQIAYKNNGRYTVEEDTKKRGFYFRSKGSRDSFLATSNFID